MTYRDLTEFLAYLDKRGVVRHIDVAVSHNLEIAAVAERASQLKTGSPVLIFENIPGFQVSVIINLFSDPQHLSWGLGLVSLDQLVQKYYEMYDISSTSNEGRLVQLGANSDLVRFAPRSIKSGVCQEVLFSNPPSFDNFPILKYHDQQVNRVLPDVQIFLRDPHTSKLRLTVGDLNITGSDKALLTPHPFTLGSPLFDGNFTQGTKIPVALTLGGDPSFLLAALSPLPPLFDELTLCGFLRRARIETVKCKTSNLEVPANSEYVFEGNLTYIPPVKIQNNRNGFMHSVDTCWSLELVSVSSRKQPILPSTLITSPASSAGVLKAIERALAATLHSIAPVISDIAFPTPGLLNNLLLISIRKRYAGQAQQIMNLVWGSSWLKQVKTIIVVDEDCDIHDYEQVVWRVAAVINPKHDLVSLPGLLSIFDHTAFGGFGSKMGVDATRKFPGESHGIGDNISPVKISKEIKEVVDKKWPSYGID